MIEVRLRKNPEFSEHQFADQPKYFLEVDLKSLLRTNQRPWIPVYWRPCQSMHVNLKEMYAVEILATPIEKGNLQMLAEAVRNTILGATKNLALPRYFLSWKEFLVPVYPAEGELETTVDGLRFRGKDICRLWTSVAGYLTTSRKISNREVLQTHMLSWADLNLHPPVCFLTAIEGLDFRMPVFRENGKLLPALHCGQDLGLSEALENTVELRRELAQALMRQRKISHPRALIVESLEAQAWEELKSNLRRANLTLRGVDEESQNEIVLPVYRVQDELAAVYGSAGGSYYLFFGPAEDELKDTAEHGLARVVFGRARIALEIETLEGGL